MKQTRVILTGGFLGAGKTTLLWNTAQKLIKQGLRVGLITNDQAPELVDSALLKLNGLKVSEVSGSCFCCNFNGFTDVIQDIRADMAADIIIAEPVGSCTDLSATIIQPLKKYWNTEIIVSPLSVLVDPIRLKSIVEGRNGGLHPDAAYIYRKQMEESDIILINKADLLEPEELNALKQSAAAAFPASSVMQISAINDEGIDEWLNIVTSSNEAGKRLVDVDYDVYANGEAVLGWLNGTINIEGNNTDWDKLVHRFMTDLSGKLDEKNLCVGHVKVIAENGNLFTIANITGTGDTLTFRSSAGYGANLKLIVNARVETSPQELDKLIRETIYRTLGDNFKTNILAWKYLQPGRPTPTHRFSEVVL
jgi:Ni2+-binding GTPase involved in maturation of urease and hydrogenase